MGQRYRSFPRLVGKRIEAVQEMDDGTIVLYASGGVSYFRLVEPEQSNRKVAEGALRAVAEDARVQPLDRIAAAKTLLAYGGGE